MAPAGPPPAAPVVPVVVTRSPEVAARARVTLVDEVPSDALELLPTPDGLALEGRLASGDARLLLDFSSGQLRRRLLEGQAAPVVKALGKASRGHVLDATAGLLRDALTVARVAARVTAVERHGVVWALAGDALERLTTDDRLAEAAARVRLLHDDAAEILRGQTPGAIDGVIIDPMFSEATRGAPKKDLALLQRLLVGGDDNATVLFEAAVAVAPVVVVKRSAKGAPLADGVHHAVTGKGFRWDVYRR